MRTEWGEIIPESNIGSYYWFRFPSAEGWESIIRGVLLGRRYDLDWKQLMRMWMVSKIRGEQELIRERVFAILSSFRADEMSSLIYY